MGLADIALVSCVKSKTSVPSPAKDLYVSPLFRGLRDYSERNAKTWFILSAEHGLLHPETVVAPYERTLLRMRQPERSQWAARVVEQLMPILARSDHKLEILLLGGARYREFIAPALVGLGHEVSVPLEGLGIGKQLAWLKNAK